MNVDEHPKTAVAPFRELLLRSLLATVIAAVAVAVCYSFVDRRVTFFVHEQQISGHRILHQITLIPPILQWWAPVVLALLAVRRGWGPLTRFEWAVLAGLLGLLVADQCKETLKYVFGRTWPDTWIDDNPSLLRDGVYGFHPFRDGDAYSSFPSGHTARTLAIAAVGWAAYPRWRWLCVAGTVAIAGSLVGMNYHFVSDVIAGGFLGGIVGAWFAVVCGLNDSGPSASG